MFKPRLLASGRACCTESTALCATCKAHHAAHRAAAPPAPYFNPAERLAIRNGWTIGEFLAAQLDLASARPLRAAAAVDIPPAPDQHARIRAARGLPAAVVPPVAARARIAVTADDIPPAPDQHARIRAALR